LRRVATLVAEGAPPASLLAVVAEEVARVVDVPLVSIVRYEADGTATELASFSRRGELFPVGTRWSLDGTNVVAHVHESGRPARINDYSGLEGVIAETVRRAGIHSTVGIPIVVLGRLWGAMVVSSAELEPLPEGTEARLADFTELVATAIANAESLAELDASRARIVATADATRRRIERDLHDGAQQQLVSLALEVRAVQALVPPELGELRAELSRVVEGQTSVLDGLREIAHGIHPAILAEGGLGPALKTLARRSAIPVELDVRAELRLPEAVEVTAYYVVSEALTNAAKYARASAVHVAVEARARMLRVLVRDDGEGGADPDRGSGLLGLKDRAEAIGGTLSLQSPPGAGTSLQVELPLDDDHNQ
jgi:signal transduction histidine kinase